MRVLFLKKRDHWCEDCCEGMNSGFSPLFLQTCALLRSRGIELTAREYAQFPDHLVPGHDCVVLFASLAGLESQLPSLRSAKEAGAVTVLILHDSFDIEAQLMTEFDFIDYAVLYPDRELGLYDLVEALDKKSPLPPSVLARSNGKLLRTPVRPQAENLHHLLSAVEEMRSVLPDPSYTHAYLTVGRGCNFGCGFCDLRRTKNRNRHPEAIADEMAFMQRHKNLYGREPVSFIHPLFGGNLQWTEEVSEALLRKNVQVPWRVTTHYHTVKENYLALWRRAGCVKVSMGLEHMNDPQLKPVNLARFKDAVEMLRAADIQPMISVILGIWEDDDKALGALEEYIRGLQVTEVIVTPFYPLRGTPMYESYRKRDLIGDLTFRDYIAWGYKNVMLSTAHLNKEEIRKWQDRLVRSGHVPMPGDYPATGFGSLRRVAGAIRRRVGALGGMLRKA